MSSFPFDDSGSRFEIRLLVLGFWAALKFLAGGVYWYCKTGRLFAAINPLFILGNVEEKTMVTSKLMRPLRIFCMFPAYLLMSCLICTTVQSYELLLATDEATTFSSFAGKRLCLSISRNIADVSCKAVVMENSVDVLTNIQGGSYDFALVNAKMIYDAFHKIDLFQYTDIQYDDLRLLLPLYREPVSLLVRENASIGSFRELAGKRVNGGAPLTIQNFIFEEAMKAMGWTRESFSLYQNLSAAYSQDYLAFNSGSVQAMVHIGMHPDWKLRKQITESRSRLLPIDDPAIVKLADSKSGFCFCVIEGGTYPGYKEDMRTLAVETFLITSAEMDDETVAEVLESIYASKDVLQRTHPAFLRKKVDIEILNDSYLHPHPAAVLFFQQYIHKL